MKLLRQESGQATSTIVAASLALVLLFGLVMGGCALIQPRYKLYKAGVEKRIRVEEAKAQKDAAILLAQAELERAKGVANANEEIAGSITPEYLRYFYILQLSENADVAGKVIYVPTEGGIPVLEAGRGPQETP
jgi:hypothetical protein